jgi:hypothetical protein
MSRTIVKRVALAAALTVGLAAATQAETIGKAIGYTKIELPDAGELKLVTIGLNAESGGSLKLSDILGDNTVHGSFLSPQADQVYVYDQDNGYTGYYKPNATGNWKVIGGSDEDPTILAGQGFWISGGSGNPGGKTIYLSGQAIEEKGLSIQQGLNMVGNGITAPIDLVNDIDWSTVSGATKSFLSSLADQIYVYNGGYAGYFLNNSYQLQEIGGSVVTSLPLEVGDGFWYIAKGASVDIPIE